MPYCLDLILPRETQLALDLHFHGQPVGVPTRPAGNPIALHRPETAEQVLVDPRPDMVEAGLAVGGRRSLIEHQLGRRRPVTRRALEDALLLPQVENAALETGKVRRHRRVAERRLRWAHGPPTLVAGRSEAAR